MKRLKREWGKLEPLLKADGIKGGALKVVRKAYFAGAAAVLWEVLKDPGSADEMVIEVAEEAAKR